MELLDVQLRLANLADVSTIVVHPTVFPFGLMIQITTLHECRHVPAACNIGNYMILTRIRKLLGNAVLATSHGAEVTIHPETLCLLFTQVLITIITFSSFSRRHVGVSIGQEEDLLFLTKPVFFTINVYYFAVISIDVLKALEEA